MSNVVNFSSLKRKNIRKELVDGIIIYNPSPEQKADILKFISKNIDGSTININGRDILLKLIPILTNIEIPSDMSEETIFSILNDPDDMLLEVVDEINIIVKALTNRTLKTIEEMKDLPKEQMEQIINELAFKSEKEKKKEELLRQLRELEEENKKD